MELTQSYLKSILHYDPETGIFTRIVKVANNVNIGDVAGGIDSCGYVRIRVKRQFYSLHRLAFFYMTGAFPSEHIDHINGIRHDNRWANLRPVMKIENRWNLKKYNSNTSGTVGVSWHIRSFRWLAHISKHGKRKHLGRYTDFFEACCARKSAENLYGFHPNHGKTLDQTP